jgi:hypothetical protein
MTRTELLRRRLANKLAATLADDVKRGRSYEEAYFDACEESARLEAEGAPETEWVTAAELAAAYDRIVPPDLDWRDVPPPY